MLKGQKHLAGSVVVQWKTQADLHADAHRLRALHLLDDHALIPDGNAELHRLAHRIPQRPHRLQRTLHEAHAAHTRMPQPQQFAREPDDHRRLIALHIAAHHQGLHQPRGRVLRAADDAADLRQTHPLRSPIQRLQNRQPPVQRRCLNVRTHSALGTLLCRIWNVFYGCHVRYTRAAAFSCGKISNRRKGLRNSSNGTSWFCYNITHVSAFREMVMKETLESLCLF